MTTIIATVSRCVQIGENDFIQDRISRVFNEESTIKEILDFAEANGIKSATINDIVFSREI